MSDITRVLSMVPQQLSDFDEKLQWLKTCVKKAEVDIAITPQEFFGGVVMMPHRRWISKKELLPQLKALAKRTHTALVVGVCEALAKGNKEALWYVNERGEYLGAQYKCALPKYDHVATTGGGRLIPETDLDNRFQTFTLAGLEVTGIFCWEVYATTLWAGLGLLKPDLICNCVKFGPNAWPIVRKDSKTGDMLVEDFGYGTWKEEGGWIDRLKIASHWETRCPITTSCNSWNLRPVSMPICGTWCGLPGQGPQSLWHPQKGEFRTIPEKLVVDELERDRIRAVRKNKFVFKDAVGEFPPIDIMRYTMLLKMARVEDRLISGREAATVRKSDYSLF